MIINNLCDFCRHKNLNNDLRPGECCLKQPDFVRPLSQKIVSCSMFECLPFAYMDVSYKMFKYPDKFIEIGLVAPRTFKRERNKNQIVLS